MSFLIRLTLGDISWQTPFQIEKKIHVVFHKADTWRGLNPQRERLDIHVLNFKGERLEIHMPPQQTSKEINIDPFKREILWKSS